MVRDSLGHLYLANQSFQTYRLCQLLFNNAFLAGWLECGASPGKDVAIEFLPFDNFFREMPSQSQDELLQSDHSFFVGAGLFGATIYTAARV